MQTPGQAVLLRIYTDENALVGDRSLMDVIVQRAQANRLAGATVLRGPRALASPRACMSLGRWTSMTTCRW